MRRIARLALPLGLVAALAACGDVPQSPREVLDELRAAVAGGDGVRIYELQDAESRGVHRQHVRTLKARVARGDELGGVLEELRLSAEEVLAASDEELAGRFMVTKSIMALDSDFLVAADVVEEESLGPEAARITLHGTDERRMRLWFLIENGVWVLDAYRGTR